MNADISRTHAQVLAVAAVIPTDARGHVVLPCIVRNAFVRRIYHALFRVQVPALPKVGR